VLLVGGWTVAAARQPRDYNPIRDTISALAAQGASDRWIMTSALFGLGACHLITAVGLRPARLPGRLLLAGGGVATVLVAAFPQPRHGNSVGHTVAATAAFSALALWPLLAARTIAGAPLLRLRVATGATLVMVALVLWFVLEIHGNHRGLAERTAAGAQALWPAAVVFAALMTSRSGLGVDG